MIPPSLVAAFDQFAAEAKANGNYRPTIAEALELCAINFTQAAAAWKESHPDLDEMVPAGVTYVFLDQCAEAWGELVKILEQK